MKKEKALLAILSDGEWHSGEDLAQTLGVSRTAVWKQLNRLMEQGVTLERLRGKGYRLTSAVDLLDPEAIQAGIEPGLRQKIALEVLDSVDSTNAYLMQARGRPGSTVNVCVADRQLQGRGRRGRVWSSPAGENVYLSMAVALQGGFVALEGLSLVIGVAVARALEALGLSGASLKWPNDVLVDGRKLAGILIELQGELEGAARVVIGIGINVHMSDRARQVDQAWTSLDRMAPHVDWVRNRVISAVIEQTLASLDAFEAGGFSALRPEWEARDALRGQPLRTEPDGEEGIGAGIDEAGAYLLETADGVKTLRAGEISIRPRQ